jgi:hypothetical protein
MLSIEGVPSHCETSQDNRKRSARGEAEMKGWGRDPMFAALDENQHAAKAACGAVVDVVRQR